MTLGEIIKGNQAKLGLNNEQVAKACGVGKAYIAGLRGNSKAYSVSERLANELAKVLQLPTHKDDLEPYFRCVKLHNKKHQAYRLSRKSKKVAAATEVEVSDSFPDYFVLTREEYIQLSTNLDSIRALLKRVNS